MGTWDIMLSKYVDGGKRVGSRKKKTSKELQLSCARGQKGALEGKKCGRNNLRTEKDNGRRRGEKLV